MRLAVLASLAALTACHSQPPPVPAAAPRPSGTRPLPVEDRTTVAPTTAAPAPTTAARPRRAVRPTTTMVVAEGNEGAAAQTSGEAFWRDLSACECPSGDSAACTGRHVGLFQFSHDTARKVGIDGSEPYEEQRAAAQEWARRIHPREGTTAGWPTCWGRAT